MAEEKVFAVIGLGVFGMKVCETLAARGCRLIAMDNQPENIEKVKELATQAILVDSTDDEAMSAVPMSDVDIAIVAIADSLEASIVSTAILKKAGVPMIIARSISEIHRRILEQLGADEVVNVEVDQGHRLATRLASASVLDTISLSESISLAELYTPAGFANQSLIDLDLRNRMKISVVAIRRTVAEIDEDGNPKKVDRLMFPSPEEILQERDVLLVLGNNEDIEQFKQF